MNVCDIRAMFFFLQTYVIMPGGLSETENKSICQISGLKSFRGRLIFLKNI